MALGTSSNYLADSLSQVGAYGFKNLLQTAYQDNQSFGPVFTHSRKPIHNNDEEEVNNEPKHRCQQHFIVEVHLIRPPPGLPQKAELAGSPEEK